jgi:hypothetical protein
LARFAIYAGLAWLLLNEWNADDTGLTGVKTILLPAILFPVFVGVVAGGAKLAGYRYGNVPPQGEHDEVTAIKA